MNPQPSIIEWGTMIPSIIGGIIAGATGWIAAVAIHKRERNAVRQNVATAIYKEMDNLLGFLEGLIGDKKVENITANAIALQLRQFELYTDVYDSNLDKIGVLGAERAGEIISFYNMFKLCIAVSKTNFVAMPPEKFVETLRSVLPTGRAIQKKIAPLVIAS